MSDTDLLVDGLWCYIVSVRGQLYAIPDNDRTTLLPHIGRVEHVVPLPLGLVPPYVIGMVNVNQAAEVVIDLGSYLGIEGGIGAQDERRICVLSEAPYDPETGHVRLEPYRLAFAVDAGYELVEVEAPSATDTVSTYVQSLVTTARGDASLLQMENICSVIITDLGGERPWNGIDGTELPEAIAAAKRDQ